MLFNEAIDHCKNKWDWWGLPTIQELRSLLDFSVKTSWNNKTNWMVDWNYFSLSENIFLTINSVSWYTNKYWTVNFYNGVSKWETIEKNYFRVICKYNSN